MTSIAKPNYKHSKIPAQGRSVPGSALVLDGGEVKLRLQAERTESKTPVHVDWVRFTCFRRNVVPSFLPVDESPSASWEDLTFDPVKWKTQRITQQVLAFRKEHQDPEFVDAMNQAYDLAREVCGALGPDFEVHPVIGKGFDFYKFRWSIYRNDAECGWVGFLASSSSPRASSQSATVHTNLYGAACTFAAPGWNSRIADILDMHDAKLTRADLALDFFDGMGYDMEQVKTDYMAGAMDSNGKRLKCNMVGDWANGGERSFYIGSKEAGKQTNIYEKGHQLYGRESQNPWVRVELRYGNKLRVLSSDMLRRPSDFFAGASDWHALQLSRFQSEFTAQKVPTAKALPLETVKAEVSRNVRWILNTAAQSISTAMRYLSESQLHEICDWNVNKVPGRLRKFNPLELQAAFSAASTSSLSRNAGPAFATA